MIQNKINLKIRPAQTNDIPEIWKILQQAIALRREDGSPQWQDGYPNEEIVRKDVAENHGYVFILNEKIAGYAAIFFDLEPEYEVLKTWENTPPYAVIHRVAVGSDFLKKGIATEIFRLIEKLVIEKGIESIRVDTIFDNLGMLRIFEKLNYTYRGEVYFRGSARKAFEKKL
ncbi:GCN5 family acetyltransferase [Kaistella solincola]|uniref:GCN5 family acetyltransferase n=1 Tax=Kaistella solincola TaxID=510955 RepID=A0ABR4ZQQ0_9FLAO|nr:GNAT family N-acetyltransferase [Kaistella solincola]KIA83466.1 GCN5 family acetyltransferase [Kaistella solincola]